MHEVSIEVHREGGLSSFVNAGKKLTDVPELHLAWELLSAALTCDSVPQQHSDVLRKEAAGWCWVG